MYQMVDGEDDKPYEALALGAATQRYRSISSTGTDNTATDIESILDKQMYQAETVEQLRRAWRGQQVDISP